MINMSYSNFLTRTTGKSFERLKVAVVVSLLLFVTGASAASNSEKEVLAAHERRLAARSPATRPISMP